MAGDILIAVSYQLKPVGIGGGLGAILDRTKSQLSHHILGVVVGGGLKLYKILHIFLGFTNMRLIVDMFIR